MCQVLTPRIRVATAKATLLPKRKDFCNTCLDSPTTALWLLLCPKIEMHNCIVRDKINVVVLVNMQHQLPFHVWARGKVSTKMRTLQSQLPLPSIDFQYRWFTKPWHGALRASVANCTSLVQFRCLHMLQAVYLIAEIFRAHITATYTLSGKGWEYPRKKHLSSQMWQTSMEVQENNKEKLGVCILATKVWARIPCVIMMGQVSLLVFPVTEHVCLITPAATYLWLQKKNFPLPQLCGVFFYMIKRIPTHTDTFDAKGKTFLVTTPFIFVLHKIDNITCHCKQTSGLIGGRSKSRLQLTIGMSNSCQTQKLDQLLFIPVDVSFRLFRQRDANMKIRQHNRLYQCQSSLSRICAMLLAWIVGQTCQKPELPSLQISTNLAARVGFAALFGPRWQLPSGARSMEAAKINEKKEDSWSQD